MKKPPPSFAARLRELREASGLTPAALAQKAGMSRPVYHRIEAGQRLPSWASLRAIRNALGCSLAAFDDCA